MKPPPNALAEIVRLLDRAGVDIALEGDQIAVSPAGLLTNEVRHRVAVYRSDIIELLRAHGPALLALFRDPTLPKTKEERILLADNAAHLHSVAGRMGSSKPLEASPLRDGVANA
jgi:hypothetical protein